MATRNSVLLLFMLWLGSLTLSRAAECHMVKGVTGHPPPNVNRFIVFTRPRSGSTWTSGLFGSHPDIMMGGEAMFAFHANEQGLIRTRVGGYKRAQGNVTWEEWEECASYAYSASADERTCQEMKGPGSRCVLFGDAPRYIDNAHYKAVGFKLMAEMVPPQLEEKFVAWLVEKGIIVIHLVREATVLRRASWYFPATSEAHTSSKERAEWHRLHTPKAPVSVTTAVGEEEDLVERWRRKFQFTNGLRYHYLSYESLLGPDRERYYQLAASAITAQRAASVALGAFENSTMQAMHEQSCENRLANFSVALEQLEGSRTASACAYLHAILS